ncbi:restriction endonuclease, SacI family [Haloarcula sp. Atlit-47R]|uniref:restriction endonuclease, SacI family n=1 Tax=Haloarcula sp. Atlit-47R TaxID=2282132 RepID=UPI000EF198CA|nr:restriction endonuclease, SacI family [Haloarcula sp. Atlit-47R]RLM41883.1 restriction endonuclease, SacI family [Haloarcula sp. Atlit-47R]
MSAITIDTDEATDILESTWQSVQTDRREGSATYLTQEYRERIREIITCDEKAYRYLLVTAAVAKATDERVHYRALKKGDCDLNGAYAPRTTAKQVVMPWNLKNGNRLEASSYPLAGNPIQSYAQFQPEDTANSPGLREELYHLLKEFQQGTANGSMSPSEILHAVLDAVADLEPRKTDFEPVTLKAPYQDIARELNEFLAESGSGERLMAVTAGFFDICWQSGRDEYTAHLGHANAADEPRGVVGDVWVEAEETGDVVAGVEVKHKSVTMEEVLLARKKAKESSLKTYYVVADSFKSPNAVREIAADAQLELILVTVSELMHWLQPLGQNPREALLNKIGTHLQEMGASSGSLHAWEETIANI